jgi:hypothetical protein
MRHSLTLSDGQQFTLDPNAPVTKDGEVATLKDIQQGDEVWASFAPGSPPTVDEVSAQTPAGQIMDGIPTSNQQPIGVSRSPRQGRSGPEDRGLR